MTLALIRHGYCSPLCMLYTSLDNSRFSTSQEKISSSLFSLPKIVNQFECRLGDCHRLLELCNENIKHKVFYFYHYSPILMIHTALRDAIFLPVKVIFLPNRLLVNCINFSCFLVASPQYKINALCNLLQLLVLSYFS